MDSRTQPVEKLHFAALIMLGIIIANDDNCHAAVIISHQLLPILVRSLSLTTSPLNDVRVERLNSMAWELSHWSAERL
ncbi:hypothetical protein KIN20_007023 [Parelaphostrongylus tenuis]|uniref:Uncharacterized protein n=1 Tax=Parelaphostrongylus tenuis TaxID=148309 RepID=A0AAD5MNZ8_PARTN|nr:hypothetical protein KIN20_007023 [Parelaphostrongylus tenuis]